MFRTSERPCPARGLSALLLLLLLPLLVTPLAVHAQSAGLELEVAPDAQGCVSELALRARLERFLRVHRPIEVEVVVRADAEPVAFELRHEGMFAAERRFDVLPVGCAARLDALALAIAVAVEHAVGPERASLDTSQVTAAPSEPAAATPTPTPTPPAEAEPKEEPEKPAPEAKPVAATRAPDEPSAEAAPEAPSAPLELALAALLGGDVLIQALPEPALALHAGAELHLGPIFAVSLAGLFAPSVDVELADARAASTLLGARALGCAGSSPRGLRLEACLGAVGGVVWSSGEEGEALQSPADVRVGWVAGALRAAASYPAGGVFGARLALDAHLNLLRPGLRVKVAEGEPPIRSVSGPVGAAASIELWLALP